MAQEVTFKVDYVVPSINREFGTVIMGGQNVALDVVADGWAKVGEFGLHFMEAYKQPLLCGTVITMSYCTRLEGLVIVLSENMLALEMICQPACRS